VYSEHIQQLERATSASSSAPAILLVLNSEKESALSKERIRDLNDAFRTTFRGGKVVVTQSISHMELAAQQAIFAAVQTFDNFNAGNDPHDEHDFGSFEFDGEKFFWKIDYYDPSLQFGSENPSDPAQTARALTIMRASEY